LLKKRPFNDPELLDAYDYSAWVTVPHPLNNTNEFMRRLRKQPRPRAVAAHDDNDDNDIKAHLRDKRYLIIVDDLLKREEWYQVRSKLFNFQNAKGSCLIVMTRWKDVTMYYAGSIGNYELKPLGDTESRNLLCKKVNPIDLRFIFANFTSIILQSAMCSSRTSIVQF
jgi:hypothetical protein